MSVKWGGGEGSVLDRNDRGSCEVVLVSVMLNCELLAVRHTGIVSEI